jgi:hypothetical protein
MPVLMHIGDEANDANTNITIRTTNWPRFAEILETDFGPITRIESVEDLESAAGALEDKIKSAMTDSTRTRVEPRQKEILPQWIVDLIGAKIVPGALPFGLATLSTEQRQIGLATKSNTRSSIIALIGGKPNLNISRRRTTRSGEWRKRSVQTTSHFPPFRVQTDSSSRTWTKRRRSRQLGTAMQTKRRRRRPGPHQEIENQVRLILSRHDDNPPPASPSEIRKIIGSLKKKKAPGPDNISNTALKLLPPKVVVTLAAIFNASLRLCHFPSRWKNATVIFIPKPGKNSKLPQSNRPISLLSSIGKVLEKVILTRLVKVTDENSTIPDEQFGFRPKHSTVDQLINVTEFIAKGFGQNQSTGAIFLDVAKAFDTVWHDGLVYKLHAAGVPMAMVRLLNSFLNRRVFHAKILSTQREIQAGVPQGSVLSPTLYAIFTADIPKPDNTKIALYADDTAILVRSWSPEIISRDLQGAVENLESWFRTWRIDVNPEKSSAILFTKRHFRPVGEVAMFNRVIPWTTVVKYLGVKFDNHLTFIRARENSRSHRSWTT